ncbi:hypothetical protein [Moraxella lacunata]
MNGSCFTCPHRACDDEFIGLFTDFIDGTHCTLRFVFGIKMIIC